MQKGSEASNLVLVDAGHSGVKPNVFIPGAIFVDLGVIDVCIYEKESGERELAKTPANIEGNFNLRPDKELRRAIERMGINAKSTVVCYTQSFKSGYSDQITCGRFMWALMYAGVTDVRILDRGIDGWKELGYTVSASPAPPRPRTDFTCGVWDRFPLRPHLCTSCDEIENIVDGSAAGAILADVRSWDEFTGLRDQYPYLVGLGRIPGARWAHWGTETYVGNDFMEKNGKMRDFAQVRQVWEEWGITEEAASGDSTIIFYCGSGWRAAYACTLALLMGFKNVSSYDGGFLEWNRLHRNASSHKVLTGWNDPLRNSLSSTTTQLPSGWKAVSSPLRRGYHTFVNTHTGERIAWFPSHDASEKPGCLPMPELEL